MASMRKPAQKALAEPDGEYGEYFYFEKGKDGNPPSNYRSYFGGSAWEKVPGTDKFVPHKFLKGVFLHIKHFSYRKSIVGRKCIFF